MRDPRSTAPRPAPMPSAPPPGYPPGVPQAPQGPPAAAWHPVPPAARVEHRLYCPKCRGELLTYERAGVHLEQCGDCRGIWLDRGELDRLIDAEATPVGAPAREDDRSAGDDRSRRDRDRGRSRDDDDDGYERRERWDRDDDRERSDRRDDDERRERWDRDDDRRGRPSRRRGMFGELFEGLLE